MGRAYAGFLGPLAFLTLLAREFAASGDVSTMLLHAWCALVSFAVLGGLIGWLGGRIVEDSVRAQINNELAALEKQEPKARAG